MRISDWSSDVCSSDLAIAIDVKTDPFHGFYPKVTVKPKDVINAVIITDGFERLAHTDILNSRVSAVPDRNAGNNAIIPPIASHISRKDLCFFIRSLDLVQIGRPAFRERGCQYVKISVAAL